MTPDPKPKTQKDPKYRKWIKGQPCVKCKSTMTEPHHTETGGMGMKGSDYAAVPLCRSCHVWHDNIGKKTFWRGWDLEQIIKGYNDRYEISITQQQK